MDDASPATGGDPAAAPDDLAAGRAEALALVDAAADVIELALQPVEDDDARKSGATSFHCILEGRLYMGGAEVSGQELLKIGVNHVVRVLDDSRMPMVIEKADLQDMLLVEVADVTSTDLRPHFPRIQKFISEALRSGGIVYVHCGMGRSRAATATLSYLVSEEGMNLLTAFTHVITRRDISAINMAFVSQLVDLDEEIHGRRSLPLLAAHLAKRRRPKEVRRSRQKATAAEMFALLEDPEKRTREPNDSMSYMSVKFGMRELRQLLGLEESRLGPCPKTRCAAELLEWLKAHGAAAVIKEHGEQAS
eukprot:gnl/TRDRNA2_/TRDRNA2_198094_c0_seq1.p1 gnl/TRDRNA2_/TRDRNA2_198094_c0~~gnl/TRDRNA2_/TRDRNA2_198094_c0_seq1.p1  ORF type:complete len:307 (+),score=52.88 gnl/TRDRNA2_/TRDRNA2_198094_c0_seq1:55-975(+)